MSTHRLSATIGLLAAIIYNSWPLGYFLNPSVVRVGLASDLQASGQPYSWVFIAGDVLFGLLVTVLALLLIKRTQKPTSDFTASNVGLVVFGAMTAASALIPLNCTGDIRQCGYEPGQTFGLHDLIGAIAAFGLFWAMLFAIRIFKGRRKLQWVKVGLLILWSAWGIWFLYASLFGNYQHPDIKNLLVPSQQVFLILSGLAVWLLAYGLGKVSQSLEAA